MKVRTILVTGAGGYIGKAICEALIEKKIRVVGISRNEARHHFGPPYYESHLIDLADTKNLPTRVTSVIEKYGQFNGLISCAGVGNFGSIENFSLMQIEESLRINLLSHIVLTRYLVPSLKKQNGGYSKNICPGKADRVHQFNRKNDEMRNGVHKHEP